jgi:hypothetical protein
VVIGRTTRILAAMLLGLALCAWAAPAQGAGEPSCADAPATAARTAGVVAERIYGLELSSAEVGADRAQIESYGPLSSALAGGSRAAVLQAVTHLVYSGTHIVRLRVTQGNAVLADVGGPYILAPTAGAVRFHGRAVGRYVFSVQDDLGYVKLENRFIGAPLILRQGVRAIALEGTIAPARSAAIPDAGPVVYRGGSYQAFSFNAVAFPSGALKVTLLVQAPHPSTAGCGAVKAAELAGVAQTVWHRFTVLGAPVSSYVRTLHGLTGGLVYVRADSRQLAGSTRPGPPRLPAAGSVRYRGIAYRVTSFAATTVGRAVRVYQLVVA